MFAMGVVAKQGTVGTRSRMVRQVHAGEVHAVYGGWWVLERADTWRPTQLPGRKTAVRETEDSLRDDEIAGFIVSLEGA